MTTRKDIVDLSLLLIGSKKINSMTDNSKSAIIANTVYDQCVRGCFEIPEDWFFAIARAKLARITDAPAFGTYEYQYTKPTNYIRPLAIIDENNNEFEYESVEEVYISPTDNSHTEVLLTNQEYVYLKYIVFRDEPNIYPKWFCYLIAAKIAIYLAMPLRGGADNYTSFQVEKLWAAAIYEAKSGNASHNIKVKDNRNVEKGYSDLLNANQDILGI